MPSVYEIQLPVGGANPNLTPFNFGTAQNPSGDTITADGVSLLHNGRRILPVMGEFHYARYPQSEWRDELLKMKAGGVDIIASYVFWIHHEETRGEWNFSHNRDLRAFVTLCGQLGLRCIIRCGPWDHGEVRNGGLPEWLLDTGCDLRTNDPTYLAEVTRLYRVISDQLHGLLWKSGGPVIGIQIENEFPGHPDHLLTLKRIAIESGLDVPIYTRTGWPELSAPMPFGHLLPLFGGYAEGFWDRSLDTMPGHYWKEFVFKRVRTDSAIASEHFGIREVQDEPDIARYPYLTCEIGPGMPSSYHRRITIFPMDVLSMVIVKLGSGSNSPGYYMYHGGTNPTGREPWLQENQASRHTNWNDLPVKSYDFQTCLGEFGQVRPQYHLLRPIHLFLRDFGHQLAPLPPIIPTSVADKSDTSTFRWSVRSDGHRGFIFINNYQRLLPMPARTDTQIKLKLADQSELQFPRSPTTISADSAFFWPFNLDLGDGITLRYATAQPICQLRDENTIYTIFTQTGNPSEFAFTGHASVQSGSQPLRSDGNLAILTHPTPGTQPIINLVAHNGTTHTIILLDPQTAQTLYKGTIGGKDCLILTNAHSVIFDDNNLRLTQIASADLSLAILPKSISLHINGHSLPSQTDGAFARFAITAQKSAYPTLKIEPLHTAGPLRIIQTGAANVAQQPSDQDFTHAAAWRISLPENLNPSRQLLLRIQYTGDVARAYLGDTLLTDNFFNGSPFEIGLNRYGPDAIKKGLTLKILPLQKNAPIYIHPEFRPDFGNKIALANIQSAQIIEFLHYSFSTTQNPANSN